MYKSKEIRWFIKKKNEGILRWFSDQGKVFSKAHSRTDFYLPIPGKANISVKLREGNVEIKQRQSEQEKYHLTKSAVGYLEDWVKWSFDIADNDALARNIVNDKKY